MTSILIVDDSEVDRRLVGGLLRKSGAYDLRYAENGKAALAAMRQSEPDLVLTDMQMPERDGLELVRAIRLHHARVPVILMTAHGSQDIAVQALEKGAASYVPKEALAERLARTIEDVLALTRADRTYERLISCLTRTEFTFALENDPALIDPLVDLVQQIISGLQLCDINGRFRVGLALKAALENAIYRGNLEVESSLHEGPAGSPWAERVAERRAVAPYQNRRVLVNISIHQEEARFVIRDEGPGFDTTKLPSRTEPVELDAQSGQGLVLMRAFMDEVQFNAKGNEVTMVKRQDRA